MTFFSLGYLLYLNWFHDSLTMQFPNTSLSSTVSGYIRLLWSFQILDNDLRCVFWYLWVFLYLLTFNCLSDFASGLFNPLLFCLSIILSFSKSYFLLAWNFLAVIFTIYYLYHISLHNFSLHSHLQHLADAHIYLNLQRCFVLVQWVTDLG